MNQQPEKLEDRIRALRRYGERLDGLDWLHRMWIAGYDADVHIVAEAVEQRLLGKDGLHRSDEELDRRVRGISAAAERWYERDFAGRLWIAQYVAAGDMLADALRETLRARNGR